MRKSLYRRYLLSALVVLAVVVAPAGGHRFAGALFAQSDKAPVDAKITTPKQEWGHNIGDDYFLANYQQLVPYWKKLATQSQRIHVEDIGPTSMGKTMVLATVTSPDNWKNIARYKQISKSLSLNEGPDGRPLTDDQARALAKEGKAVVWIDGGLHASEVLGAQQLMEMVYQMVARTDEETMRFLNDVIILFCPVNPDGQDLVVDGYMKHGGTGTPIQYNFYAGHDDNRDSYMNALKETTNISRVMYREWFPQIMYNHHQTGPSGAVMFAPPFRDPFNFNFHPGIAAATDLIGAIMQTRFIEEGKPGVVSVKGSSYSTWWNGGLRTTAYFHNQIGILTETIGNPTPGSIPFNRQFAIPERSWFWRIEPQPWHFRQSIEYSITANRAVLDFASRYREVNNFRIYSMGRDETKWGGEDHWTFTPHKTERICTAFTAAGGGRGAATPGGAAGSGVSISGVSGGVTGATVAGAGGAGAGGAGAAGAAAQGGRGGGGGGGRGGGGGCNGAAFYDALRAPQYRDPRAFIMSADAPDFGAAVRFVNALFKSGVTIHQATAPFVVGGKQYPANSLVVLSAQAFRPHVMDMFEPQDHPDDIPYPGAAPTRPYDNAGYTLAFQMGVQFDRVLDAPPANLPLKRLTDFAKPPAGTIKAPGALLEPVEQVFSEASFPNSSPSDRNNARALYDLLTGRVDSISGAPQAVAGYYFSHMATDNFIAVNRLLAAGEDVSWLFNGPMGYGTFYVASKASTRANIQKIATEIGTNFQGTNTAPTGPMSHLKPLRIGIVDQYGGNVPAGWTRLALENFEFKFEQVFPPMLDAGNLRAKYDVLLCIDACFSAGGGGRGGGGGAGGGDAPMPGGDAGAVTAGAGAGATAGAAGAAGAAGGGGGRGGAAGGGGRGGGGGQGVKDPADDRPAPTPWEDEYTRRRGSITPATLAKIQEFIEQGGTIVAVGSGASGAIAQFKLPLTNHLVKPDGTGLGNDYYVPGSVLQIAVDPKNPLAHGYGETADVFFDNSPVWKIDAARASSVPPVRVVGWFASPEPLRSGWAWGQRFLDKGIEIVDTNVGQGRLFLFGNDLMFRSQPLGSYKFLFNAMYLSVAPGMTAGAAK